MTDEKSLVEAGAVADVAATETGIHVSPKNAEGAAIARGRSLLDRAPKDLKLHWQGGMEEEWTIRVEATIIGSDEADAVREIIRVLSAASAPVRQHLEQGATAGGVGGKERGDG